MKYDDSELETKKLFLEPGDRFILFSDGITEAMWKHQEFGYDRLANVICRTMDFTLEDSLRILFRRTSEWTGNKKFIDDVTLLALERTYE